MIRVLRLIEYTFDTPEKAEEHLSRLTHSDGEDWYGMKMKSVVLPFEVLE